MVPIKSFDDTRSNQNRWRNNMHSNSFDATTANAVQTLKEDFDRQLELVSDRQNTMVQSIGIILAFASVLLMETIQMVHLSHSSVPGIASVIALFTCCLIGIATIWEWKSWSLHTGFDLYEIIEVFNKRDFVRFYSLLFEGAVRSYESMSDNNYILKRRITYLVLSLVTGTAFAVIGMVIEWA
ncbi:hypothetical protein [Candidatus Methanoplasma termitum]|nr:hypothetical protein [Candidatus Methanoplasma termitum]